MLSDIEDDGTAGASLLRNALVDLQDQRRTKSLLAVNKMKAHKRDSKAETYRKLADDLRLNWRDEPYPAAEKVRAKLTERAKNAPNVRTVARAFGAK
jgi:hypothetical protein